MASKYLEDFLIDIQIAIIIALPNITFVILFLLV